jgi:hypothetical protein
MKKKKYIKPKGGKELGLALRRYAVHKDRKKEANKRACRRYKRLKSTTEEE